MTIKEREQWIRKTIPQLEYQQWKLVSFSQEGVECEAPLEPNRNIHQTAFAGSISSLMIICGWLQVQAWTEKFCPDAKIVLKSFELDYRRPVGSAMTIKSQKPENRQWEALKQSLEKKGRGTIRVKVVIMDDQKVLDLFEGLYYISLDKKKEAE